MPVVVKLRAHAMTYPGFVSAENLVSTNDKHVLAIVYTWENIENWKLWEKSMITQKTIHELEDSLLEKPRVIIYRIVSTTAWAHN